MPILGIVASSWRQLFTSTGSYDALATYTVPSGGVSSITFGGLPSDGTYSNLQLRISGRGGRALFLDNPLIKFNVDTTTSNYYNHGIYSDGVTVSPSYDNTTYVLTYSLAGANASSNVFGALIVDILDFATNKKNKTVRYLGGVDNNGQGIVGFGSGGWFSTAPINSVTLTLSTGAAFQQYTTVSIYGVKG